MTKNRKIAKATYDRPPTRTPRARTRQGHIGKLQRADASLHLALAAATAVASALTAATIAAAALAAAAVADTALAAAALAAAALAAAASTARASPPTRPASAS